MTNNRDRRSHRMKELRIKDKVEWENRKMVTSNWQLQIKQLRMKKHQIIKKREHRMTEHQMTLNETTSNGEYQILRSGNTEMRRSIEKHPQLPFWWSFNVCKTTGALEKAKSFYDVNKNENLQYRLVFFQCSFQFDANVFNVPAIGITG